MTNEPAPDFILYPDDKKIEPRCAVYGICGGCRMQDVPHSRQIAIKQNKLMECCDHAGVQPERLLDPLTGPAWAYRRRARLGVKNVARKGRVLVGFRERQKPYIVDMHRCEILDPRIGERIDELSQIIGELSIAHRVPQIEVALGDDNGALVFRVLDTPSAADHERLRCFGQTAGLQIHLQPGGLDTIHSLTAPEPSLSFNLPEWDLRFEFGSVDFVQINAHINHAMVSQAMDLLKPTQDEHLVDLFCGLGNFSLPMARLGARVTGVEGDKALVERACHNAVLNQLGDATFVQADLYDESAEGLACLDHTDGVLLDPPRTGAANVLSWIAASGARRVVYVSCQPESLAQDAQILTRQYGYRLSAAGIMDMFPHTLHVESMALFERV